MENDGDCISNAVRELRTGQGVSLEALARHCALSRRQVQQIEEGGQDAFYSAAIKQQAERKVLSSLNDPDAIQAMQRDGVGVVRTLPRPLASRPPLLNSLRVQRAA